MKKVKILLCIVIFLGIISGALNVEATDKKLKFKEENVVLNLHTSEFLTVENLDYTKPRKWTSSNPEIAVIEDNEFIEGKIKGMNIGTTTLFTCFKR